jgi:23S rRNA pseudouridine2605 synthase
MGHERTPAGRPETEEPVGDGRIRLNLYLARNGIASRRKADQMIAGGEVMVDGEIVTELGRRIDPTTQRVEVEGQVLRPEGERPRYYLLYKPAGVVCTNDPREARPRAIDLVTDRRKGRIYTVGRLDEDTEGLVILTNDGAFANRVSHPRYEVLKTYRVQVRGRIRDEDVQRLREGVRLSDFRSHLERVKVLRTSDERSLVLVTLREGRNREIRRVFAKLGLPVQRLTRIEIGPIRDRGLKLGEWRTLGREEIEALLGALPNSGTRRAGRLRPVRRRGPPARGHGRGPGRSPGHAG